MGQIVTLQDNQIPDIWQFQKLDIRKRASEDKSPSPEIQTL